MNMLERARRAAPHLREHASRNEQLGQLADPVVAELEAGGFFGLFTPRAVGGAELPPVQAVEVIEELARADASTAWVTFAVGLCTGAAGAYLGDAAVDRLFRGGQVPVTAGQGIPNGKAVVEKNGYRLSGSWSYGSGSKHAPYIHTGAIVHENGAPRLDAHGAPEVRIFYVPREAVSFGDNWDVIGLRGTGSIDYSVQDVFVEEDWTYAARVTQPRRGGAFFRLGTIGIGALGHTAFALGVGRRILDELAAFAQAKAGRPGSIADSESFLEGYARAEASLRAARALVIDTWGTLERELDAERAATTRQLTSVRLALNHATWTAVEVCTFAYRAAGGVSLRAGTIQRYYRDMLAASQHVTSSPPILRDCGRDLAGLAQDRVWAFMGLVQPRRA